MAEDDGDGEVGEEALLPDDLFHQPSPFVRGSATDTVGEPIPPPDAPAEVDDGAGPVPEATYGPAGLGEPPDEAIDIAAEDDDAGDDPGFLGRVAEAVGDLWDDAQDVVT